MRGLLGRGTFITQSFAMQHRRNQDDMTALTRRCGRARIEEQVAAGGGGGGAGGPGGRGRGARSPLHVGFVWLTLRRVSNLGGAIPVHSALASKCRAGFLRPGGGVRGGGGG